MVDFDGLRKKAETLRDDVKDRATGFVGEHRGQIDKGLDRAGGAIGKRTGKGQQVDNAVGKVKGFLDRTERSGPADGAGPTTPGQARPE